LQQLRRENEHLRAENAELRQRVAELEDLLKPATAELDRALGEGRDTVLLELAVEAAK
jgi:cell division protein FtsB